MPVRPESRGMHDDLVKIVALSLESVLILILDVLASEEHALAEVVIDRHLYATAKPDSIPVSKSSIRRRQSLGVLEDLLALWLLGQDVRRHREEPIDDHW